MKRALSTENYLLKPVNQQHNTATQEERKRLKLEKPNNFSDYSQNQTLESNIPSHEIDLFINLATEIAIKPKQEIKIEEKKFSESFHVFQNVPEPLEKTAQESLSKEQQENFSLGLERKIKKDGESDEGSINSSSDPDTFDGSSDSDGSDDDDDFVTVPDTCNIKDQQPDQPLEQPYTPKPEDLIAIRNIIFCLREAFIKGVRQMTYEEVTSRLKLDNETSLFGLIKSNAFKEESKIGVTKDGLLFFKPKYCLENAEDVIQLLSPDSGELRGIHYEEIEESLPNAKQILEKLEENKRIRILKGRGNKKVVFSTRPDNKVKADPEDDTFKLVKAYLSSAGDSERRMIMNYAGELQVTNITKKGPRKCSNRKRKNLIRLNSHVTDLLTYTEEELNRPSHDDIAESTRSRICSDEISNEGRQIIWDFAYLVFPFEQCLVLYTIAHSRNATKDHLECFLKLKVGEIQHYLEKLTELYLVQKTEDKTSKLIYSINFKIFIKWMKNRISSASNKVKSDERTAYAPTYKCTVCGAKYEDLDICQLLVDNEGNLKCLNSYCKSKVTDDLAPPQDLEKGLSARFNEGTQKFCDFLKRLEKSSADVNRNFSF